MMIEMDTGTPEGDIWSTWLLEKRFAGDAIFEETLRTAVVQITDRVLDGAHLSPGSLLLDIGTGDGQMAFSAIERIGDSLRAVLTDISELLLSRASIVAQEKGVSHQCKFLRCAAESLIGVDSGSVDTVVARAVLAYVDNKALAFRQIRRVLKPGGRFSIAEPILRDDAFEAMSLKRMVDERIADDDDRFFPLLSRWKGFQYPNTAALISQSAITNYGERDLVRFAMDAGFTNVHMELHVDVRRSAMTSWDALLKFVPHPWAKALGEIMSQEFDAEERDFFERVYRPGVEAGQMLNVDRTAYLTGTKPLA